MTTEIALGEGVTLARLISWAGDVPQNPGAPKKGRIVMRPYNSIQPRNEWTVN